MRVFTNAMSGLAVGIFLIGTAVNLFSQGATVPARQPVATLPGGPSPTTQATYVGSTTCRRCHAPIYERWSKTRMANVVTDRSSTLKL
jgi:hypothetical protein